MVSKFALRIEVQGHEGPKMAMGQNLLPRFCLLRLSDSRNSYLYNVWRVTDENAMKCRNLDLAKKKLKKTRCARMFSQPRLKLLYA